MTGLKCHAPNKQKLSLYGPLDIEDQEKFLKQEAKRFHINFNSPFIYHLKVNDFDLLYKIGTGAFGNILLVKYKPGESYYSMKVLSKFHLVQSNYVERALNEKRILQSLNFPFTVYLLYLSQDNSNLYFILPFISGGELYTRLGKVIKFEENLSKFYAAQVVLAFEYLHTCNVVYRDLKPENLQIDHLGYIKLTDFGLAKMLNSSSRTYTFCGTPDYVAPEIILGHGYGKAADWWTLGVFIFEITSGYQPFFSSDVLDTYKKIIAVEYVMPGSFKKDLKDLVRNLLQKNVTKRMGNLKSGAKEIKDHQWFKEVDWFLLLNRRIVPPYIPENTNTISSSTFPNIKKVPEMKIAEEDLYKKYFADF